MPLAEDTILVKRYRLDGVLARGGMGAIYRAFDTNLGTPVAIKENFFSTPERIAQFKQEAVILAHLRHPGLPRVIDHFSVAGKHYLVMDFIEGQDLWELVKERQQPLAEPEAVGYMLQVCQAVSYLHRRNPPIIHRDIKPQNIKITPDGQAVLVDFGIAKQVTGEQSRPLTGAKGVTPGFSPPEQNRTRGTTPASDIYALGATLYAVLTGKEPPTSASLITRKVKFEPPHKVNSKLSHQVSQAIVHAMQLEPADRPESVAAWQKELEAVVKTPPLTGPQEDATLPAVRLPPQDKEKTRPAPASRTSTTGPGYWLVDATGRGYPLGSKSITIGRHAEADIVVEDLSVSRYQAQIRIKDRRCQVQDQGSANGTFLNGHRLGAEWYPLEPGDLLTIGSARFHLTTTKPVKLASLKPKPVPVPNGDLPAFPLQTDQLPELPAQSRRPRLLTILVLLFLVGLISLGLVFYWLARPTMSSLFTGFSSTPEQAIPSQTQTATARAAQMTAQARADAERTRRAEQETRVTQTALAAITATAQTVVMVSSEPSPVAEITATPTRTATPTALPSTITPTRRRPTTTPTRTPTKTRPILSGPTVIPVASDDTIPRIGVREMTDVDINPRNAQEVYALVKRDGIYKSSNGGDGPWTKLKVDASSVVALVIDPTDPTQLYAPTWNAVLKSTDGGNTWDPKTNGLVSNRSVDVLVIDPNNPDILYAGVGEKLVVSTDGGENWSSLGYGNGLGLARFYQIVVDPFDSDIVYVAGLASAIYKSSDSGGTFIPMPYNVGQGAFGLAAHPGQKDVYLVGINSAQAGIVKTENAWDFYPVSDGLIYGGADSAYSALTYAPSNPNIVYAGSGYEDNRIAKGIFKSTDGGENWSRINNGLSTNLDFGYPYYIKSIAVHPTQPDVVFAATGGGLFKSVDGGANWSLR